MLNKKVLAVPLVCVYGWTKDTKALQELLMTNNSKDLFGYGEEGMGYMNYECLFTDMMAITEVSDKFFQKMMLDGYTKWQVASAPYDASHTDLDEFVDENISILDSCIYHPAYKKTEPVKSVVVVFHQEFE